MPLLRFYETCDIPITGIVTAAPVEGGDVIIVEPGCVLIGYCDTRTQYQGARQLAELFAAQGWDSRIETFAPRWVHMDVLIMALAEKLALVCTEAVSNGLLAWLRGRSVEVIDVTEAEAFSLALNVMPLGQDRILSSAGAGQVNRRLRSLGFDVLDPDLSMFARHGGGPHCLAQALRRERTRQKV